jgi:hypothetical protein
MILKAFVLLVGVLLVVSLFLRPPRAKLTGWIAIAAIAAISLLIIQALRALDTMWR